MKQISKIILSVVLIVLFYVVLAITSDITKINENFSHIQIYQIVLILGTYVIGMFVSSLRQKFVLNKSGLKISVKDSFLVYVAGLSMVITPLGSGQLIKSYYMKKKFGYQLSKTFPLLIIERFCDLLVSSIFVVVSLLFYFSESALIVSIISFIILGVFICTIKNKKIFNFWKNKLQKISFLSQLFEQIDDVNSNIKNLLKFRIIITSIIITSVALSLESLAVYFAFSAFNIELSFLETVQIFYTSIIGGMLSFIPGGVGLTEAGFIGLAMQRNITADIATSLILFIRITTIWFSTIIGFIFSILILKINILKQEIE